MARMVKLTDEVGNLLEERAKRDNTTLAGEVKLLLAGAPSTPVSSIEQVNQRLNAMGAWLKKRLDDLEAAFDAAAIASPSHKRLTHKKVPIKYEVIRDLFFDVLEDGAPEWFPQAEAGANASDSLEMAEWYTDGSIIFSEGMFGHCEWLKVSERIESFLKERGVECTL